jgi:hypothetical protein
MLKKLKNHKNFINLYFEINFINSQQEFDFRFDFR